MLAMFERRFLEEDQNLERIGPPADIHVQHSIVPMEL